MPNIGHLPNAASVWAASTASHRLSHRSYGKTGWRLDMDTDPATGQFRELRLVAPGSTTPRATYDWHRNLAIEVTLLDTASVPYVNAFILGCGTLKRHSRNIAAGYKSPDKVYWLVPERQAGYTATTGSQTVWGLLSGQTASTPLIHVNPTGVHGAQAPAAPAAPTVVPSGVPGVQTTQTSTTQTSTFVEDPLPIVEPTRPEPEPVALPKRTEPLPLPPGWQGIPHNGEVLALPDRIVNRFNGGLRVRESLAVPHFMLAVGPTGSGKTEGMIALAELAGYIVKVVDCSGFETANDVYGAVEPDENGQWTRMPSVFWTALEVAQADEDNKYCIVLDELTRSKPAAQNAFIAPLAGQRALTNPITGARVVVGNNVTIVATANIGAAYSGTEALDAALASRFAVRLNIGYLPREVEQSVIESVGLPIEQAEVLAHLAEDIRAIDKTQPFHSALVPGTRDVVQVARQAMFDVDGLPGAWDACVIERFSAEGKDPTKTERARANFSAALILTPPTPPVEGEQA